MSFIPSKNLADAVKNRDNLEVKIALTYIIKCHPEFDTNEFYQALNYVEESGMKIREPYEKQDGEERKENSNDWDEHYFYSLVNYLMDNFSVDERLPHIKEVGKAVFGYSVKTQPSQSKRSKVGEKTQKILEDSNGRNNRLIKQAAIAIAGIVILFVSIGVWIWKCCAE